MSLPELKLDDLTWTEMVEAIRNRIVAHSQGQWTMHAPVDAGVASLELFAYLFEQRLYWLDQTPAPLSQAMLALMDGAPLTTQAARTVLAFSVPAAAAAGNVPAGTTFHTPIGDGLMPMTSLEPADILPVHQLDEPGLPRSARLSLIVDGEDRSTDLHNQRPIELLNSDGVAGNFELIVWLDRQLQPSEIDGSFNLLLDLQLRGEIAPEWAPPASDSRWYGRVPQAGYLDVPAEESITGSCGLRPALQPPLTSEIDVDPLIGAIARQWATRRLQVEAPAQLNWSYSTGAPGFKTFDESQLIDGTGGLRRPGVVRIRIPNDWQPTDVPATGPIPYAIRVSCENGTYAAPPVLHRIVPNVAVAEQLTSVQLQSAELEPGVSQWLRLPGQILALDAGQPEPLENSVQLELRENDGDWHRWSPTDHFHRHGPHDRVFTVDRLRKTLLFGNGLTGRIPVLASSGAERIRLCYLAGGGTAGNVAEQDWRSNGLDVDARNVVPAIGGRDTEIIDNAEARVAGELQRVERAVTADDYETLALTTSGVAVARAHAAVGFHPGFPCQTLAGATTVFVVPEVPRPYDPESRELGVLTPVIDPGALREVSLRLEARRLVSHEVYVVPARYRAVFVRVNLQGMVLAETTLQADIAHRLTRYLDPLVGGDDGAGWPFGAPLRPSTLLHEVQDGLQQGITVNSLAIALDEQTAFEDCNDVPIGAHDLVYLAGFSATIDRTPAMQGGLR